MCRCAVPSCNDVAFEWREMNADGELRVPLCNDVALVASGDAVCDAAVCEVVI